MYKLNNTSELMILITITLKNYKNLVEIITPKNPNYLSGIY